MYGLVYAESTPLEEQTEEYLLKSLESVENTIAARRQSGMDIRDSLFAKRDRIITELEGRTLERANQPEPIPQYLWVGGGALLVTGLIYFLFIRD